MMLIIIIIIIITIIIIVVCGVHVKELRQLYCSVSMRLKGFKIILMLVKCVKTLAIVTHSKAEEC